MGYIKHEVVYVITGTHRNGGLPDMDAFRASLPEEFRQLVVGPVDSPVNGYIQYVLLADGSKEGWDTSDEGDEIRDRFLALFDSDDDEVVRISLPEDDAPRIE